MLTFHLFFTLRKYTKSSIYQSVYKENRKESHCYLSLHFGAPLDFGRMG